MSEMDHDQLREALAPYVLGALGPDEAADLEDHVERCADCRAELVWLSPAVRMLPEAVDQVEPPPRLRERVMADVKADAKRSAVTAPRRRRGWRTGFGLRPATAAFAAVLIAVAVATAFVVGGDGTDATSTTVVSKTGVTAKLTRTEDSGTLELDAVRRLPPEHVLQAWVRREGKVESAEVFFVPDEEGVAVAALDHLDGVREVMVTVEPSGGSEAPTTKPVATVSVPRA